MGYHFAQFERLVKSTAGKFGRDSLHETEDIQQELYCKLIKELPKLQTIPECQIFKTVKAILKNEIIDIQRKSATRAKLNCKLEYHTNFKEDECWTWEDAADKAFRSLEKYVPEHKISAENLHAYADLASHVVEWAQSQGGKIEELLTEFVNPSTTTLKKWYDMVQKFPTYRKFDHIPPTSVGKILGINKVRVVYIMRELRAYLEAVGYNKEYLNKFLTLSDQLEN